MSNLETKFRLLQKPTWGYKDIMLYTGYKKSNACRIKVEAIKKFNGRVPFNTNVVKTDSVLKLLYDSSREKEIKLLAEVLKCGMGLHKHEN